MNNHEILDEIKLLKKLNRIFRRTLKKVHCSVEKNFISQELTFKLHCITTNIHEVAMPTIKEICGLYNEKWLEKEETKN